MIGTKEIKRRNFSNIYHYIYRNGSVSKQDIVQSLSLSLPTVTQNLNSLINQGLIYKAGLVGNTGGRKAHTYSAAPRIHTAVGLHLSAHHVVATVVDMFGQVIVSRRIRSVFDHSDSYYRGLNDLITSLLEKEQISPESVLGVGIGFPGLVSTDHRCIYYGHVIEGTTGLTIDEVGQYIPFEKCFLHDTASSAAAEMWDKPHIQNAFYLMVNESIGGAIYINGRLYKGDDEKSAEVCHIPLHANGVKCYCGRRGCVDHYISTLRLSSAANDSLPEFFSRLQNGDPELSPIWNTYLKDLAKTIQMIRYMYDCQIIVGGDLSPFLKNYLPQLRRLVLKECPLDDNAGFVVTSTIYNDVVSIGAGQYYINNFIKSI